MDHMTQEANDSSVQVEIFDQTYSLCGPDPGYILKLAAYVDAEMRTIAGEDTTADSLQLAVLAAVRLTSENHLMKAKLEGDEKDAPGEEETTEEADSFDSLGGEVGQMRKPFTEEATQRNRERRQRHYTKRRYEKDLLAIVNDESLPAQERHEALLAIGRSKGYHRAPKSKR